jgi:hypothetical protein
LAASATSRIRFANRNDHLATGFLDRQHPLLRIQFRRIEDRGVFAPVAPLDVPEGIRAEMNEERLLHAEPVRLVLARQNLGRLFGNGGGGIAFFNDLFRGVGNGHVRVTGGGRFPGSFGSKCGSHYKK